MAGYGLDRFDRDVTVFHIQSFDSRLDLFNQLTAVGYNQDILVLQLTDERSENYGFACTRRHLHHHTAMLIESLVYLGAYIGLIIS